jgi:NifU-like protein involved in Fe-S cluster formation
MRASAQLLIKNLGSQNAGETTQKIRQFLKTHEVDSAGSIFKVLVEQFPSRQTCVDLPWKAAKKSLTS